jgi:hypothetical protein
MMDLFGCGGLGLSGKNLFELFLACRSVIEGARNFPGVKVRRLGAPIHCIPKEEHLMSI